MNKIEEGLLEDTSLEIDIDHEPWMDFDKDPSRNISGESLRRNLEDSSIDIQRKNDN